MTQYYPQFISTRFSGSNLFIATNSGSLPEHYYFLKILYTFIASATTAFPKFGKTVYLSAIECRTRLYKILFQEIALVIPNFYFVWARSWLTPRYCANGDGQRKRVQIWSQHYVGILVDAIVVPQLQLFFMLFLLIIENTIGNL